MHPVFQFHKGTIKTLIMPIKDVIFRWFQFHKGTIKTVCYDHNQDSFFTFQFHKGTIKTFAADHVGPCCSPFQFHKGTIKTYLCRRRFSELSCFNSIKVRLKPTGEGRRATIREFQFHKGTIKTRYRYVSRYGRRMFQFHKGTIKTGILQSVWALLNSFNSIKVRLKLPTSIFFMSLMFVSIP